MKIYKLLFAIILLLGITSCEDQTLQGRLRNCKKPITLVAKHKAIEWYEASSIIIKAGDGKIYTFNGYNEGSSGLQAIVDNFNPKDTIQ
jgi:hypothetical protein